MCVFHVRSFDFKITRMISAQIARHDHFITSILKSL